MNPLVGASVSQILAANSELHVTLFFIFFVLGVIGQFSDDRTTQVALKNGATEGNPVGAFLLKHLGTVALYIIKTGVFPLAALLLALFSPQEFEGAVLLQVFIAAIGFGAGIYNYFGLKAKGIKFSQIF